MGSVDGKAYETLWKAECLEMLQNHGIDCLELCRMGNIKPLPKFLCKLTYFAGHVYPLAGGRGSGESAKTADRRRKRLRKRRQ